MSWNFRKAGQDKALLKAAVMAECAPDSIKDEVCWRIDGLPMGNNGTLVIYVESSGHLDSANGRPWLGVDTITIKVWTIPFINTPL